MLKDYEELKKKVLKGTKKGIEKLIIQSKKTGKTLIISEKNGLSAK